LESVRISPDVIPGRDQVASLEAKQIEGKVNLVTAEETNENPQK